MIGMVVRSIEKGAENWQWAQRSTAYKYVSTLDRGCPLQGGVSCDTLQNLMCAMLLAKLEGLLRRHNTLPTVGVIVLIAEHDSVGAI